MARQMDLAVTADDAARLVDQHRGIEAAAVSGQFGIAEVEADAEFAGEIEQRLCLRARSEEHTSELQSLMRNSYDVFCLKKKKHTRKYKINNRSRERQS